MKLAFALLAHDDPGNLVRLVERLTAEGDLVVLHWDRKSPQDIKGMLEARLPERLERVRFAARHSVAWGQWSMVEATLACLDEIAACGESIDYVIHMSGADYPLQPLWHLKAFLTGDPETEYIESVDPRKTRWVIQGYNEERLAYRFYFSWKRHPRLFSRSIALQQFLGLRRSMPENLEPRLGSQWWALTWDTAREILARSKKPRLRWFFKRTSVADESFFQTLVADIVPDSKIAQCSLTFYHFSTDAKPLVFYDDHIEFLAAQPFFFARKLSPRAEALRDELDALCAERAGQGADTSVELAKDVTSYERLVHLHWHGPPNRRVVAAVHDRDLGDLDWNRIPYFFLMDFGGLGLADLRRELNDNAGIRCYGELFSKDAIDYDLVGEEHPGYPRDAPALRDHCSTTFLFDILHLTPVADVVGFSVSMRRQPASLRTMLRDARALPIFVVPKHLYHGKPDGHASIETSYLRRVLQDSLDVAGFPGWRMPLLCVYEDRLSAADVDRIRNAIQAWRSGEPL